MFDDLPLQPNKGQRSQGTPKSLPPAASKSEPVDIFDHVDPAPSSPKPPIQTQKVAVGLDINQEKPKPPQFQPKAFMQGRPIGQDAAKPAGPPPNLPITAADLTAPSYPAPLPTVPSPTPFPAAPSAPGQPEDILSSVEKTQPKIKRPSQPAMPTASFPEPQSPQDAAPQTPVFQEPEIKIPLDERQKPSSRKIKLFLIITLIILGLGGIGVSGWILATNWLESRNIEPPDITEPAPESADISPQITPPPPPPPLEPDIDFDGIADREEQLYGTNPNSVDTDADGLTDRDEIRTFRTDPVNPDTDGDGYQDGEEVLNGYDPKGAGKLREL